MSKGKRLRMQRKAHREALTSPDIITPVDEASVRYGQSYWITGYFWGHDLKIVEPFFANYTKSGWEVTSLEKHDMEYYEARSLIEGNGTRLLFEDRVMALRACEAIENHNTLLESFASYMTNDELLEQLNLK